MEDLFIGQTFLKLADCILKTEDGCKFKAHKIILAQSSKYFEKLFCGDFRISIETLIPAIKGNILNQILCYIYQKKDILSPEYVSDILIASDFLMMNELFEDCKKFIFDGGITTSNCIAVFNTAWKIEWKEIMTSSKRFSEIHFEEAVNQKSNKLGELNINAFKEILNCDNLNISDESIVWNAIVSWINHNISERMSYFPELLKYVRLQELDDASTQKLNVPHVIENNMFCFDPNQKFVNQITSVSLMIKQAQSLPISLTGLRKPRIPNCIYFIFKEVNGNRELYITYDNSLDYWLPFGKLSSKTIVSDVKYCNVGKLMYFSFFGPQTRIIRAFDVIEERWVSVSPVPQDRFDYSIVAVKNKIFALGGTTLEHDRYTLSIRDMVQSWDPQSNTWQQRRPMYSVYITGIVTLNDHIYVIGSQPPNMVFQCYDPCQDCWTLIPEPNNYRTNCAVIVFRGNIYIIGGQDRTIESCKVEEYNPTCNTWNELPDLPYTYNEPIAIVIENTLIVFNEIDDESSNPAIFWCKKKRMWETAFNLSKSFLEELGLTEILSINDENILKLFCQKHRFKRTKWINSDLLPLASETLVNRS